MATQFQILLTTLLGKAIKTGRFESRRAFVRAAEPDRDEDSAQAYLGKVLRAKNPKPPPLDRVRDWGKALDLKGDELDHLVTLAHLAHAPADIEREYLAMQTKLRELTERVARLESRRE